MPPFRNRVGETKVMLCGLTGTIVRYGNSHDIDVQFEDGTITEHKSYSNFRSGSIAPSLGYKNFMVYYAKKKHKGETKVMTNGMKATIIEFHSIRNVDIRFEDGTIHKKVRYSAFQKGYVSNENYPKSKEVTGKQNTMKNGLVATIIEYFSAHKMTVQFEDGLIVKNKAMGDFKRGIIRHPQLNTRDHCKFHSFVCKAAIKGSKIYYLAKHEDGFEGLLTPQEMIAYDNNCH